MKKLITILTLLLISQVLRAQAPQATSYQAVIRNSNGNVLSNQLVKVRFSIRDSAANGTVVYQETQTSTTNAQGLINLFAGQGTAVIGTFAGINWGSKSKFLQTEIDIAGGNNFTDMGTMQLMSVPYALYSNNGNPNGTAVGEMLYWNGTSWVKINPGANGQNLTFCNGVPQWGPCLNLPTVLTGSITAKTAITATAGGNVTDSGSGAITARGVCFSTTINPTIANTKTVSGTNVIGAFTVSLTGLSGLTTYHYRAYATTSVGTSYGADSVFTTNAANVPSLTTTAASAITATTATSGGNITSDNGATITARGICWSTIANPTTALTTKTIDGNGTGTFTSSITGLTSNTTYYVRAYATNSTGTAYGTQQTFTSASAVANLPSVTIGTQVWTTQNLTVARYRNGDVIPQVTDATQWANLSTGAWCWYNNDSATYAATYGRLYNWYAVNDLRGLAPQGYHIPTDAEWNKLVKYLDEFADTTCEQCYQSTIAGDAMKSTTGWNDANGGVTNSTNSSGFAGLPGAYRGVDGTFDNIGNFGNWWSSTEKSTTDASFRFLYHYDSYVYRDSVTKRLGFSVRCVRDTAIIPSTPMLTTTIPTNITSNAATSGGNITSDGGATITARGICWSTTANPTFTLTTKTVDGTGTGVFTSSITGLTSNTTYYVRAYATNSAGTAYGTQQTFTTTSAVVSPIVTIGTQVWTTQNLSVARYRNGDIIPQVTNTTQWAALTTGAWCWYNNDSATYAATYGRLYNWYAVNDARGLAPQGYHVPSDGEWSVLVTTLGGLSIAGGSMKSTTGWNLPNTGATNSSGFAGLPGGFRDPTISFGNIGYVGMWWSSTEVPPYPLSYALVNDNSRVDRANNLKSAGFSVRCVRD
jgi:uncharacterized protein (TIGR02145 family)